LRFEAELSPLAAQQFFYRLHKNTINQSNLTRELKFTVWKYRYSNTGTVFSFYANHRQANGVFKKSTFFKMQRF